MLLLPLYFRLAVITNGTFFLDECEPIVFQQPHQLENLTKDLGALFGGSLHRSKSLNKSTHYVLRSKTCQPVAFEERKCTGSLFLAVLKEFQLSFRTVFRWVPALSARSLMAGRGVQDQATTPSVCLQPNKRNRPNKPNNHLVTSRLPFLPGIGVPLGEADRTSLLPSDPVRRSGASSPQSFHSRRFHRRFAGPSPGSKSAWH